MKKEWEYEGKKYVVHNDENGNYYLNGYPYHCMDILPQLRCEDDAVISMGKYRAKEVVDEIEEKERFQKLRQQRKLKNDKKPKEPKKPIKKNKIGISEVVFLTEERKEYIKFYLSKFESKSWEYEGKQYVAHYDVKANVIYLNGYRLRGCHDIWFNVDSWNETISWRAKHKAKEISIEILESTGMKVDRLEWPEQPMTISDKIGFALLLVLVIAVVVGILYFIYEVWWFCIGDWAFNGPFADWTSPGEVFFETVVFILALLYFGSFFMKR